MAQTPIHVAAASLTPTEYSLTPPNGACYQCEVQVNGGDVYFTPDATVPSATNGVTLTDGNIKTITRGDTRFSNYRFKSTGSGTPTLSILWTHD